MIGIEGLGAAVESRPRLRTYHAWVPDGAPPSDAHDPRTKRTLSADHVVQHGARFPRERWRTLGRRSWGSPESLRSADSATCRIVGREFSFHVEGLAMPTPDSRPVTLLLQRIERGDASARDELFRVLYAELHLRARAFMRRQAPGGKG